MPAETLQQYLEAELNLTASPLSLTRTSSILDLADMLRHFGLHKQAKQFSMTAIEVEIDNKRTDEIFALPYKGDAKIFSELLIAKINDYYEGLGFEYNRINSNPWLGRMDQLEIDHIFRDKTSELEKEVALSIDPIFFEGDSKGKLAIIVYFGETKTSISQT